MHAYLGIALLFGVALFSVQVVSLRYRYLTVILLGAVSFRVLLIFIDHSGLYALPGSAADGAVFMRQATDWAALPWSQLMTLFDPNSAHSYSWIGAVAMKVLGAHPLVFRLMNLVAGIWVVIFVALLAQRLWGEKAARLTAAIAAFYPFAAINSAITLRDEFSILFFVFGLYFFTKWARAGGGPGILLAFAGFACASIIHPGWSVAFLGVGAYVASILVQIFVQGLKTRTIRRRNRRAAGNSLAVLAVAIIGIVMTGGVQLGKGIEVFTEESDLISAIEGRFDSDASGGSAYPAFVATGDPYSQPWLIPSRLIYFVLSPFPWDIRSPVHLLGLVSSVLYFVLCWRIYRAFPRLRERPECVAMLFMLFALVFVFAIGTTNIGTAIRHRTKFLVLFVLLAGPEFAKGAFLPRIRWRSARTRVPAIH